MASMVHVDWSLLLQVHGLPTRNLHSQWWKSIRYQGKRCPHRLHPNQCLACNHARNTPAGWSFRSLYTRLTKNGCLTPEPSHPCAVLLRRVLFFVFFLKTGDVFFCTIAIATSSRALTQASARPFTFHCSSKNPKPSTPVTSKRVAFHGSKSLKRLPSIGGVSLSPAHSWPTGAHPQNLSDFWQKLHRRVEVQVVQSVAAVPNSNTNVVHPSWILIVEKNGPIYEQRRLATGMKQWFFWMCSSPKESGICGKKGAWVHHWVPR